MPAESSETSLTTPQREEEGTVNGSEKTQISIPPEEGLAGWLSIIGCSCGLFSTFGFLNA
jgi:hypothetical protein